MLFSTFTRGLKLGGTRMKARIAVLFVSVLPCAACQSDKTPENAEIEPITILPFVSADELPNLDEYLDELYLRPGTWREENGSRICDGYMTRFENEDYCSSTIPDGWVPFEYDGETYYAQPLADSSNEN